MSQGTTRQFTYFKNLTSIGTADDTIRFPSSIQFRSIKSEKKLRLIGGHVSTRIPNVYNYGGYNNGLVRVSNDDFATHTDVQLNDGIYTVADIMSAINHAVSSWHTDVDNDPAFIMEANDVIGQVYIIIDSTKLATGTQFAIDFSQSSIYDLLGFVTTKSFNADGTYSASDLAKVDTFGNLLSVQISGFGAISIVNTETSNEIATIDLTNTEGGNLYRIKSDQTTAVNIYPPFEISAYTIKLVGSRDSKQILLQEGEVKLIFELTEF